MRNRPRKRKNKISFLVQRAIKHPGNLRTSGAFPMLFKIVRNIRFLRCFFSRPTVCPTGDGFGFFSVDHFSFPGGPKPSRVLFLPRSVVFDPDSFFGRLLSQLSGLNPGLHDSPFRPGGPAPAFLDPRRSSAAFLPDPDIAVLHTRHENA